MTTTHAPVRALRGLRAALAAVATPLVPEDLLDIVDPMLVPGRARVEWVEIEPGDGWMATITMRPSPGWQGHLPGQYLRLGVDIDGVRHWRTYSLTSPPSRHRVTISVKAIDGGLVSSHLVHNLAPGDIVHLAVPGGDFCLTNLPSEVPVAFVTGGTGITPVLGILRSLAEQIHPHGPADDAVDVPHGRDIALVHCVRSRADALRLAEIESLAGALDVTLHVIETSRLGRLTADQLCALVPDLDRRVVYACGPAGLLDLVEAMRVEGRVSSLVVERFQPLVAEPGEGGTVTLARQSLDVEVGGSESILATAEEAGALLPSGCRMGICFGCVVPLHEGSVRDLRTGEIVEAADGVNVQTCVSSPAGRCVVDI